MDAAAGVGEGNIIIYDVAGLRAKCTLVSYPAPLRLFSWELGTMYVSTGVAGCGNGVRSLSGCGHYAPGDLLADQLAHAHARDLHP